MRSVIVRILDLAGRAASRVPLRNMQSQAAIAERDLERRPTKEERANYPSLAQYYSGKNLFMTGATGFCGKPIIEKLLRSCPDIQGIYCLTRAKKGVNPQDRLREMFNDPLFDNLKARDIDNSFMKKVHAVEGDICEDNYGLKDSDIHLLQDKMNIVVHSAATINFNEPIDVAVNMNLLGSQRGMNLAKGMKNLESFLHLSTAYAYANRRWMEVKEDVYEPNLPYRELIEKCRILPQEQLPELEKRAIGDYPNTYSATKGITEYMIMQEAGDLPMSIIRPSVVISAYREPSPGWICSGANHGLAAILYWAGRGNLRGIQGYDFCNLDLVPVDMVTNSALAAIWKTALEQPKKPPIYNVTTSNINPCSTGYTADTASKTYKEVPFTNAIQEADYRIMNTRAEYLLRDAITHWAPAITRDIKAKLTGDKQKQKKIAMLMEKMNSNLGYFLSNQFNYVTENFQDLISTMSPKDQQEFWMHPKEINWDECIRSYALGVKQYIAKQPVPEHVSWTAPAKPSTKPSTKTDPDLALV